MKKTIIAFLLGILLSVSVLALAFADQPIKLIVNGKEVPSDVPPQVINGRTMVPARFLAEALGAKVEWDEANNAIVVTSQVKDENAIINTKPQVKEVINLPSPGMINIQTDKQLIKDVQKEVMVNGEIYVLVRNVLEAMANSNNRPLVNRQQGTDGENSISIDGKKFDLSQIGAKEIDGYIYIPLSPLQNAGALIYYWNNDTKTVTITR